MLMVVMDDMSRYPVVEVISSTSANTVIASLEILFSLFSIPEVIRTDNGPPFNSQQFKEYAVLRGFKHRKITPYWPQANGECERFMRTMEKALRIAKINGKSWKTELQTFLSAYRTTPHCTTKRAPSELLFNRPVRSRLPQYIVETGRLQPVSDIQRQDDSAKMKMKVNADGKRRVRPNTFKIGDTVLVKQERTNKLSSIFEPTPYKITATKGSMITAARTTDNRLITRNSSFFKPFSTQSEKGQGLPPRTMAENLDDDDDSEFQQTATATNAVITPSVSPQQAVQNNTIHGTVRVSRYGRPIITPARYRR
jgi:hypothetical protein